MNSVDGVNISGRNLLVDIIVLKGARRRSVVAFGNLLVDIVTEERSGCRCVIAFGHFLMDVMAEECARRGRVVARGDLLMYIVAEQRAGGGDIITLGDLLVNITGEECAWRWDIVTFVDFLVDIMREERAGRWDIVTFGDFLVNIIREKGAWRRVVVASRHPLMDGTFEEPTRNRLISPALLYFLVNIGCEQCPMCRSIPAKWDDGASTGCSQSQNGEHRVQGDVHCSQLSMVGNRLLRVSSHVLVLYALHSCFYVLFGPRCDGGNEIHPCVPERVCPTLADVLWTEIRTRRWF